MCPDTVPVLDSLAQHSQVLTFTLGDETYGVDILSVQEIRGWSAVTLIPNAPHHVLGVLNLRGSIVPIIDLRKRLSLEPADYTAITVVIVLSSRIDSGTRNIGMVVDGVSDVVDISAIAVEPVPALIAEGSPGHVRGIASIGERMIILLDSARLIGSSNVTQSDYYMTSQHQLATAS